MVVRFWSVLSGSLASFSRFFAGVAAIGESLLGGACCSVLVVACFRKFFLVFLLLMVGRVPTLLVLFSLSVVPIVGTGLVWVSELEG